jgi:hypothetical protein
MPRIDSLQAPQRQHAPRIRLYNSSIRRRETADMPHPLKFDASITIGPHHLKRTFLEDRVEDALEAVRRAVRAMDGADWIDVAAQNYPPECQGWVTLYPAGCGITPDTEEWREQRRLVEEIAMNALIAAGAPF